MRTRNEDQDRWHERGFAHGIAVACATMVGVWGEEVAAEEILTSACLDTRAKMKRLGVDDYDLTVLAPVFKTLARRRRRRSALTRPLRPDEPAMPSHQRSQGE